MCFPGALILTQELVDFRHSHVQPQDTKQGGPGIALPRSYIHDIQLVTAGTLANPSAPSAKCGNQALRQQARLPTSLELVESALLVLHGWKGAVRVTWHHLTSLHSHTVLVCSSDRIISVNHDCDKGAHSISISFYPLVHSAKLADHFLCIHTEDQCVSIFVPSSDTADAVINFPTVGLTFTCHTDVNQEKLRGGCVF